jgi:ABC-type antimicrobial peptide transport system permease subunit
MVTIAIMMFLCFFSLSASMSANLYEQTKEIGILRSMGVTKVRITLLYFYEALILVFSSSFLGIIIGVFVGWTMKLQMDLFLNQSSEFFFPWM